MTVVECIVFTIMGLLGLFAAWALNECRRIEMEIMREALADPSKRKAASALWCAPREWRNL